MEKILLHELLAAVGGKLLTEEKNQSSGNSSGTLGVDPGIPAVTGDTEILSVVTDSRKITPGCVFFALCGERFDGHAFTDGALEK